MAAYYEVEVTQRLQWEGRISPDEVHEVQEENPDLSEVQAIDQLLQEFTPDELGLEVAYDDTSLDGFMRVEG